MRNTTERKVEIFPPLLSICPYCGEELKVIKVNVFGKEKDVPCWASCGCPDAIADDAGATPEDRRYFMAGIPRRYLDAECHLNGNDFAVANGRSLYITGPNGAGKTYYSCCLARKLVDSGMSVMFIEASKLISAIKSSYFEHSNVLERAYGCDVLILDDLGKEVPTDNTLMTLFMLVNERYNARRPVIITSNYSRGELAERWSDADESTAESIVSRLCENCDVVTLHGRDRRMQ